MKVVLTSQTSCDEGWKHTPLPNFKGRIEGGLSITAYFWYYQEAGRQCQTENRAVTLDSEP